MEKSKKMIFRKCLIVVNLKYYLLLFFVTIIWGTSFFFIKESLNSLNSFEFLFLRFLAAVIVITPFFMLNIKKTRIYDIISGAIIGILLSLVLLVTNLSLEYLSSAKVAIYTGMSVIIIAIIDTLVSNKWNRMILISVFSSFIGLTFLLDFSDFNLGIGDILGLFLSIIIALHFITTEKTTQKGDSFLIGIIQIYFALIVSIITLYLFSDGLKNISFNYILNNEKILFSILYTGGLGTALAFVIQTVCIKKVSSIRAAIIFNFEPVVGVLFPIFMSYYLNLGKSFFTLNQSIGFILIIFSMFLIVFENKKKLECPLK